MASGRLNRSVSYRNNPIGVSETAEETAALLMVLQSGEGEARTIAIMRLAMAGDLHAFRLLLTSADADGLYIYASRYLNSDDTVCIDPEMERAVLAGLRDPKRSRGLVGLLGNNTYRDSRTLKALLEIPFEPTPALVTGIRLRLAVAWTPVSFFQPGESRSRVELRANGRRKRPNHLSVGSVEPPTAWFEARLATRVTNNYSHLRRLPNAIVGLFTQIVRCSA